MNPEPFLKRVAKQSFFNTAPMDLKALLGDPGEVAQNLLAYVRGFSPEVRDVFERFEFAVQVERLAEAKLLFLVAEKFAGIDLHPDRVSNAAMESVFEELIRKFAEASNETAGDHFTPRDVIRLMVDLVFVEDDDALTMPGVVRTVYDPTAGTGGMLSVAEEHLKLQNPHGKLTVFGQELNPESYAICNADMLIKGQKVENIAFGNTLSEDGHPDRTFDYMLANPPFGVEWKKVEKEVRREHEQMGHAGRFGPGLPRVSDGSLLFLLHMLSKMRPLHEGGCRFGIVLNGSPLFTGGAGGGESEIRRHLLESDLVEAIVALPTDMFFNTGIATYVWVISNKKPAARRGTMQLIDGSGFSRKMRKSLGSKRRELGEKDVRTIVKLFGANAEARVAVRFDAAGKDAAQAPFAWVAADTVYGVGDIETALRRAGKGYVLGVTGKHHFRSWGKEAVAGTADDIAASLGEGTKGARLHDWAYVELADLDAKAFYDGPSGTWTRGLLIRRAIADGDFAFFTTWCPAATDMTTLVHVEGHRWSIEDSFETAKNELGLDHNETRSWHGWNRHVSLVMLALAMMAVIRQRANATTPPKTMPRIPTYLRPR